MVWELQVRYVCRCGSPAATACGLRWTALCAVVPVTGSPSKLCVREELSSLAA